MQDFYLKEITLPFHYIRHLKEVASQETSGTERGCFDEMTRPVRRQGSEL